MNKSDLTPVADMSELKKYIHNDIIINASTSDGSGIKDLKNTIINISGAKNIGAKSVMLSNIRHINAVSNARNALENAKETLLSGIPMDLCAIDVSAALEELGQITGISVSADIVDKIFSEFCVGK